MKKFTGIVIIMALVLMQNVDQTEGFGEFSDRIMINKYVSHTFAKNEVPKDQHPCIEHQALSYVMKNLHTLPVSANSAGHGKTNNCSIAGVERFDSQPK